MPTNRTRRVQTKRRDLNVLTHDIRDHLVHGWEPFPGHDALDYEEFKESWAIHGPQLMQEYFAGLLITPRPGYADLRRVARPFGWWLLDHRQERPIINRAAFNPEIESRERANPLKFEFLHSCVCIPRPYGRSVYFQMPEAEYLWRANLLAPEEVAFMQQRHGDLIAEEQTLLAKDS